MYPPLTFHLKNITIYDRPAIYRDGKENRRIRRAEMRRAKKNKNR